MEQGDRVIVLFDDQETWSCLSGCWLGYVNEQQYRELERGVKPRHLPYLTMEPLEPLVMLNAISSASDDGPDAAEAVEQELDLQAGRIRHRLSPVYSMGFDRYLAGRKEQRAEGWFHQAIIDEVRLAYEAGRKSVLGDVEDGPSL